MNQRDRNIWIEQAKERVKANAQETDSYVVELMGLYDETANQLELEVRAMFSKYAKDNNLTDVEASRLLSGVEYNKWNKSVKEYVDQAAKEGKSSRTLLELNTLSMKTQISRKEQLLANIYQNMIDLSGQSETKLTDLLSDMLQTNYYRGCYNLQSGIGLGFNVAKINDKLLEQVLTYPWSGNNFSESLWENTDKLAALAKREITLGFINGSSVQKMAKEINDIMGKGRYAAERLVRTESSYFANQGQLLAYQEMGIDRYVFLGGGCSICAELNGEDFAIEEGEPGVNLPPIHPNCKCTTNAYFKSGMFKDREGANPLDSNPKFQDWKQKYVDNEKQSHIIKLTNEEQHALNKYISSESYTLNEKLRNNSPLSDQEQKWIQNLDAALDKMPEFSGTLYRSVSDFGIEDVEDFVTSHVIGSIKSFPAYTSSSAGIYDESFPIQYVINSKHGRDIRSMNQTENEILFPRNSKFVVTAVKDRTIYMEEL